MRRGLIGLLLGALVGGWASPADAQFITQEFRNNASTTLASDISDSDTSIPLASGQGAEFPSSGHFLVTLQQGSNLEIVECTGRSTDTLTSCTRGVSGSAVAFTTGASVYMGDFKLTMDRIKLALGEGFIVTTSSSHLGNETVVGTNVATALSTTLNASGGLVSTDGTATLTNKTLDAEGTGNSVTVSVKLPFIVAVCQNGVASLGLSVGATAPSAECVTGTNTNLGVARFPDSDGNYDLQGFFPLPGDWAGAIDFAGVYRGSGTSGNVVWQLSTVCVADAETVDPSFNSAQDIVDAVKGTTLQLNDFSQSTVTTTGCAAGETFFWRLRRQRTHASDTATGTLDLVSLTFTIRRAM